MTELLRFLKFMGWFTMPFVSIGFVTTLAFRIVNPKEWVYIGLFYLGMLTISLVCFAFKPGYAQKVSWLMARVLIPLTLGAISAVSFEVGSSFLVIVGWFFYYLAMITISAFAFLAALELALRALLWARDNNVTADGSLDLIMSFMDSIYLKPLTDWLPKTEVHEMTILRDPLYTVEQILIKVPHAFSFALAGGGGIAVVGMLIVLLTQAVPFFNQFEAILESPLDPTIQPTIGFPWIPIMIVLGLAIFTAITITTVYLFIVFVFAEWNRRTYGAIFTTNWFIIVGIKAPYGTPLKSRGPVVAISEVKLGSAGERPDQEARTPWGKLWDGFLWKWSGRGIADLFFPVQAIGGADTLPFVTWADTTDVCVKQIGLFSKDALALNQAKIKAIAEVLLDPKKAEPGWMEDNEPAEQSAETLRRLHIQRMIELTGKSAEEVEAFVGEDGEVVNLIEWLRKPDPNRWNRKEGKRTWTASIALVS